MRKHWLQLFLLLTLLQPLFVFSHNPSNSYLTVHVDQEHATVQLDIALRDLDFIIGLDRNGDGQITWREATTAQSAALSYVLSRLSFTVADHPCILKFEKLMYDKHVDEGFAVFLFLLDCGSNPKMYEIDYRLFFEEDQAHKAILTFNDNGKVTTSVLGANDHDRKFTKTNSNQINVLSSFIKEGISHIWGGVDHLFFLLSLLLPAVMIKTGHQWKPINSFSEALKDCFAIITSFTLSHSITLSLAALEIVIIPSRWIESAIALTVVAAAINNLYPVIHRSRWAVTFIFGLVHGFGFASSLAELELPASSLLLSIFGFNVGVEIGQLIIVLIFLPIAFYLRRQTFYSLIGLKTGSIGIIAIGFVWFIERAFNFQLF